MHESQLQISLAVVLEKFGRERLYCGVAVYSADDVARTRGLPPTSMRFNLGMFKRKDLGIFIIVRSSIQHKLPFSVS